MSLFKLQTNMNRLLCVSVAFKIVIACDFVYNGEYNILNKQIADSITIKNEDTILIEFDLKLIEDCYDGCNILKIQLDQDPLLQLSIDGQTNYFQISTINNDDLIEDILIPNANQILPSDSQYHTINITMSPQRKSISIDGINEYIAIIANPRSYKPILISTNYSYPFIIKNPSSSSTSIGSIRNICITSMSQNITITKTEASPSPLTAPIITTNITVNEIATNYILVKNHTDWFSAEIHCQNNFGTHLATIISDEDLREAIQIINKTNNFTIDDCDIWIGLNDILNDGEFVWTDGTSCDYLESGDCKDDPHWIGSVARSSDNHCGRINTNYILKGNETQVFECSLCDPSQHQHVQFLCNGMYRFINYLNVNMFSFSQ